MEKLWCNIEDIGAMGGKRFKRFGSIDPGRPQLQVGQRLEVANTTSEKKVAFDKHAFPFRVLRLELER